MELTLAQWAKILSIGGCWKLITLRFCLRFAESWLCKASDGGCWKLIMQFGHVQVHFIGGCFAALLEGFACILAHLTIILCVVTITRSYCWGGSCHHIAGALCRQNTFDTTRLIDSWLASFPALCMFMSKVSFIFSVHLQAGCLPPPNYRNHTLHHCTVAFNRPKCFVSMTWCCSFQATSI